MHSLYKFNTVGIAWPLNASIITRDLWHTGKFLRLIVLLIHGCQISIMNYMLRSNHCNECRCNSKKTFLEIQNKIETLLSPTQYMTIIVRLIRANWVFGQGYTAWNVPKYGVISGPYFSVFSPNTGKYGPEITPYLDTFHAMASKG